MNDWQRDLSKSNAAFLSAVWPVIKGKCGGGTIKPVEILPDDISRDLDRLCGIDIWQTIDGEGCRGIASRVQFGSKNWRTFTVRKCRDSGAKTEFEKRKDAIESGGRMIYPYLTCHAYLTDSLVVLGGGLALTKSVFDAITDHTKIRRTDNASFYAVDFDDVEGVWEFGAEDENHALDNNGRNVVEYSKCKDTEWTA